MTASLSFSEVAFLLRNIEDTLCDELNKLMQSVPGLHVEGVTLIQDAEATRIVRVVLETQICSTCAAKASGTLVPTGPAAH